MISRKLIIKSPTWWKTLRHLKPIQKWVKTSCSAWKWKIKKTRQIITKDWMSLTNSSKTRNWTEPVVSKLVKFRPFRTTPRQCLKTDWQSWFWTINKKWNLLTIINEIWRSLTRHSTQSRKQQGWLTSNKFKTHSSKAKSKTTIFSLTLMS